MAHDMKHDDICCQLKNLDASLTEWLDDENFVSAGIPNMLYEEDIEVDYIDSLEPYDPSAIAGDIEEEANVYNDYLGAELYFDVGPNGGPWKGTVRKHLKGEDGHPVGQGQHNPFLDTRKYKVNINGMPHEYAANTIAENLYSQVDLEGRHQLIFREIIDHRKNDDAIPIARVTIKTSGGQSHPVITTKAWELKVVSADSTASWLPMCEVKNVNPVETSDYAVASKIEDEPAFKWWVSTTLKKRQAIVAKVKSRYWRTTHKFRVQLPHSVEEAHKIDEQNRNAYWRQAIEKEM